MRCADNVCLCVRAGFNIHFKSRLAPISVNDPEGESVAFAKTGGTCVNVFGIDSTSGQVTVEVR